MSSTPEGKVKKAVKRILKPHIDAGYVYCNWPVPSGYGESTLDCFGWCRGRPFAIETKSPGSELTPRQLECKARMEMAGGIVFVIGQEEYSTPFDEYAYSGMQELEAWLLLH